MVEEQNNAVQVNLDERKASIRCARRIVLKLGTKVLLSYYQSAGKNDEILKLIDDIAFYQKKGYEFAIVTSGAVGFGMDALGLETRPPGLKKKQALASIGQALLMQKWNELFASRGLNTGQILVTYDIIENRKRFLHTRDCLLSLFRYGAVPIINENDSVSVDELKFGDNDTLSALVSSLIDADLLVLFTDTDGLYTANPHKNKNAKRIDVLDRIDDSTFDLIDDRQNSLSLGGMTSKLQAALRSTQGGANVIITNGFTPNLRALLEGDDIGTYIKADQKFHSKRKRWIFFNHKIKGKITVDAGAVKALVKGNKSLLPGGVTKAEGNFLEGAIVGIYDQDDIMIAKGITYYSSVDIDKIKGQRTGNIDKKELKRFYDEIIHRDNMIIVKKD
ncbi:MAG: glutamate 5-kinase [Candidatus Marinimicrobia bacterium]|nr:glutamate 5-kinase [Candidatus Neomarinimicrobiota bacterium]